MTDLTHNMLRHLIELCKDDSTTHRRSIDTGTDRVTESIGSIYNNVDEMKVTTLLTMKGTKGY